MTLHWKAKSWPWCHQGSPPVSIFTWLFYVPVYLSLLPWPFWIFWLFSHRVQLCEPSLPLTISQSLPKFMSIESVMPSNHLILRRPLLLLTSIFLSIRVFSNESALHIRWPKYWSFSFNISPSNEHPGLISFRMDWLDLLAVQGTLKSLLQCHSLEASIQEFRHVAFLVSAGLPPTPAVSSGLALWILAGLIPEPCLGKKNWLLH